MLYHPEAWRAGTALLPPYPCIAQYSVDRAKFKTMLLAITIFLTVNVHICAVGMITQSDEATAVTETRAYSAICQTLADNENNTSECREFSGCGPGCSQNSTTIIKTTTDFPEIPKYSCVKQANGLYPNFTQQCDAYFRCENGVSIADYTCPLSQKFNMASQTCENDVTCTTPTCHRDANGAFWLPGTRCRTYYFCQDGVPLVFNCPFGQQFNKHTQACVSGGECYEPLCAGRPDGDYADTTHACSRYLQCRAGRVQGVASCPPGTRHDERSQSCLPATLVHCDSPLFTAISVENVQDDCQGYSDGAHVLPSTDCRRYQLCHDGKSVGKITCPIGMRFNGVECQQEKLVSCEDDCTGRIDGYYPDTEHGCRKYYFCRKGTTIRRESCPDGSLYAASTGMCVPAPLVSCPPPLRRTNHNPCLGLSDGYHGDYLHGCTNYFFCANYNVVLASACPAGSVWSGGRCIIKPEGVCQPPQPSEMCHGLTTGLYQHLPSHCHDYTYCHNGNATNLRCPEGRIFDGENCADENDYTCPSRDPKTCFNRTDGYRLDSESGCRAYYLCSNQHKTTFICLGNEVFNGTVCVPHKEFPCPAQLTECSNKPDGYYPDFQSNCRNYFYCENNVKLNTISCGLRRAFDGTRCVRSSNISAICKMAALKQQNIGFTYT